MPNNAKKIGTQLDLLTIIKKQQNYSIIPKKEGSLNIHNQLCTTLSDEIAATGLSRYTFCGLMSELLAQDVTESMMNGYTAQSKMDHRFPAEFLPAFKCVANSYKAQTLIARASNLFIMPPDDTLRAEVRKKEEQIEALQKEKEEILLFLKLKNQE